MLFGVTPLLIVYFRQALGGYLLAVVMSLAIYCYTLISRDSSFKRFRLLNADEIRPLLHRRLPIFVLGGLLCLLLFQLLDGNKWFHLPRSATTNWLLLLLIYPLFSVWPQELIYRTFFFHRYKKIVPNKMHRMALSAIWFGFGHIIYGNVAAVLLAFIGGLLFAYTYATTRSTLACVVEHSIWGTWLFTVGLGQYIDSQTLY